MALRDHGFVAKELTLSRSDRHYTSGRGLQLTIAESVKTRVRFLLEFVPDNIDNYMVGIVQGRIHNYFFPYVKPSQWINACIIVAGGRVSSQIIPRHYERHGYGIRSIGQNASLKLHNSDVQYYGLGAIGPIKSQDLADWHFSSSIPKFVIPHAKSRQDLSIRIGGILSFIAERERDIFSNAAKLRKWQIEFAPNDYRNLKIKRTVAGSAPSLS